MFWFSLADPKPVDFFHLQLFPKGIYPLHHWHPLPIDSLFCCSAVVLTRWHLTISRLVQRQVLPLDGSRSAQPSLVTFLQTSHSLEISNSTSSRKHEKCRKLRCTATETVTCLEESFPIWCHSLKEHYSSGWDNNRIRPLAI